MMLDDLKWQNSDPGWIHEWRRNAHIKEDKWVIKSSSGLYFFYHGTANGLYLKPLFNNENYEQLAAECLLQEIVYANT